MTFQGSNIKDADKMVHNEFTESLHGKNVVNEARRRADILRSMQNTVEIKNNMDKLKLAGCSKCRARLENPHADYHLTAVIDDSKI
jgi:hypothetical protein